MIYLVPMGGHGTRFQEAGYDLNKACIPTIDRRTGKMLPMVVCAMKDLPGIDDATAKIICVGRDFHATNGTEDEIHAVFPTTHFIHDHVLLDQAFGCFLAREFLMSEDELFVGACDTGCDIDLEAFDRLRQTSDVIVFTHCGDENIARDPYAHSWLRLSPDEDRVEEMSLKKTVSEEFMRDHATTGLFWFRNASVFLSHLEAMIWKRDTLNGKYYVDRLVQYFVEAGQTVRFLDVTYLCWGTPRDYEEYQATYKYWAEFIEESEHFVT